MDASTLQKGDISALHSYKLVNEDDCYRTSQWVAASYFRGYLAAGACQRLMNRFYHRNYVLSHSFC
jgi:hypothetical protein